MKRLIPMLLAILVLAGCHAPMPSFNLLAPYGSTRIPPPATGAVGPNQYYQPGQQSSSTPPVGTGFRARQASTNLSADTTSDAANIRAVSGSDESGRATRATLETKSTGPTTLVSSRTVVESRGPIQGVESGVPRALPPNVRGMRINEVVDEPAQFFPTVQAIDITQLPPASSVQYANVVPVNQAIGTSTTNSRVASRSSSTRGIGWQPRD